MAVYELNAVAAGKSGELIIGRDWRLSFGFVQDTIAEFRRRSPQAEVTLRDLLVHELLGALRARKIHIVFVPSEFISLDKRMAHLAVQSCDFVVVLPARDKLAKRRKVSLRELAQETWMLPASPGTGYKTFFMRICRQAGFKPNCGKTANTTEGMLSLIAAGYGVSLLPRASLPKLSRSLRAVSVDCAPLSLWAVWLKDTHSQLLDRYVTILRETLAS
jgi:DNA-binding transcriptional LysR family regulator